MLGVKYAALDPCDLCADKRSAVFEILRTIYCPDLELPVVSGQSLQMLLPLVGQCGVVKCRSGKRSVEVMARRFQSCLPCPKQVFRPCCGLDRRRIIARHEARLPLV